MRFIGTESGIDYGVRLRVKNADDWNVCFNRNERRPQELPAQQPRYDTGIAPDIKLLWDSRRYSAFRENVFTR